MKIIFTICSNNYLAQAKTLGDSVIRNNPDYQFIIFLCDKKSSQIDYKFFEPHKIIEAQDIGIKNFRQMVAQYNIIELNTSIKPFVFDYLLKTYKNIEYVMYFDPDIYVYEKLIAIEDELKNDSILMTPHIYTPIEFDGKTPTENIFAQYGIYNLGFLALKKSEDTDKLIQWWKRRLEVNCYIKPREGIFVDQLPMNFAPIFFNNIKISKNWGLNIAPWNLHERTLTLKNTKYFINDKFPLIFYHFSNFSPLNPNVVSIHHNRVSFDKQAILKKIYDEYKTELLKNNYEKFVNINCVYTSKNVKYKKTGIISKVFKYIKKDPLFLFKRNFWS